MCASLLPALQVFNPSFTLHDVRPVGGTALVTRWTMTMPFTPARALPPTLRRYWQPELLFTGVGGGGAGL